MEEPQTKPQAAKPNLFYQFDSQVKKVIPNFNIRAVLYMTLIFALALFLQIWHVSK